MPTHPGGNLVGLVDCSIGGIVEGECVSATNDRLYAPRSDCGCGVIVKSLGAGAPKHLVATALVVDVGGGEEIRRVCEEVVMHKYEEVVCTSMKK